MNPNRQLLIDFQNYIWNTKGGLFPMHPKNIELMADTFLSQYEGGKPVTFESRCRKMGGDGCSCPDKRCTLELCFGEKETGEANLLEAESVTYITPTGALMSENDFNHLSTSQQEQCKVFKKYKSPNL